jgi:hypothetical protein
MVMVSDGMPIFMFSAWAQVAEATIKQMRIIAVSGRFCCKPRLRDVMLSLGEASRLFRWSRRQDSSATPRNDTAAGFGGVKIIIVIAYSSG